MKVRVSIRSYFSGCVDKVDMTVPLASPQIQKTMNTTPPGPRKTFDAKFLLKEGAFNCSVGIG